MQEFFFTIVAIWVVIRLFGAFSSSGTTTRNYQQTNNHFYSQQKKEGEVKIENAKAPESKIPPTEGEYVDYEDVK